MPEISSYHKVNLELLYVYEIYIGNECFAQKVEVHRKWNVFLEDLKIMRLNFQECVQWKLIIDNVKNILWEAKFFLSLKWHFLMQVRTEQSSILLSEAFLIILRHVLPQKRYIIQSKKILLARKDVYII